MPAVNLFAGAAQDSSVKETHDTAIPQGTEMGVRVRPIPAAVDRISFAKSVSGGVDSAWGTLAALGAGMAVNQTGGNLVITSGTTVRAETIIRGTKKYLGALRMRCRSTLSQRIANVSFYVELVDVLGVGLTATITSATAVTVAWPAGTCPFTAANVGQSMFLGAYAGSGTFVPGRYPIASVSGDSVTYTVAGFAAGSGPCDVFGWNYYHLLYDGTTATSAKWDTQRNGWNSGDTAITINTTATPGHLAIISGNDMQADVSDQLVASAAAIAQTHRGSRVENVPDDASLQVQIRVVNGTAAPASTTTWTIGMVSVGNWSPMDTVLQDVRPMTVMSALPVDVQRIVTAAVNATLVAGTVRAGFMAAPGIWYDTTSTVLAASATFTGTSRDLTATATATAFANASTYATEYRAIAWASHAGTLYVEVSRDNATWKRVKAVAAAQADGTSLFYAEIVLRPGTRYVRPVYINGGTLQTDFGLQEMLLAA